MQLQSLFQIRRDHMALINQIEEAEGELTPEIEQALALNEEQFQEKAISYGFIVKHFDATEAIIQQEIKRLSELKERAAKRAEMFKATLEAAMKQYGIEKIDTPTLKLSFRKSTVVEIIDEEAIPNDLKELVPESYKVSKTKLKEAIQGGAFVAGAKLTEKKNLQIK